MKYVLKKVKVDDNDMVELPENAIPIAMYRDMAIVNIKTVDGIPYPEFELITIIFYLEPIKGDK